VVRIEKVVDQINERLPRLETSHRSLRRRVVVNREAAS
jgi:hypothetical protein